MRIYYWGLKSREKADDSKRKEIEKNTKEISEDIQVINTRLTLWRTLACTKLSSLRELSVDRSH